MVSMGDGVLKSADYRSGAKIIGAANNGLVDNWSGQSLVGSIIDTTNKGQRYATT